MIRREKVKHPKGNASEKEVLNLSWEEWKWPLFFMLTMTMTGLNFPLGYLLLPIILINRFKNDRYDFIIMLTIFFGGYSLITAADLHINVTLLVVLISIIGLLIFKRTPIVKQQTIAFALYVVMLIVFANLSDETMRIQIYEMCNYLSIGYFIVPLLAFSGREFDMKVFFKHLFPYALIFCIYYFLDCVIINDNFFMPRDVSAVSYNYIPTFYNFNVNLLAMQFPRLWPLGLYLLIPCIVPVVHYYKLKRWHWIAIAAAFLISRTFTFTIGLLLTYLIAFNNPKRLFKYCGLSLVALTALYFIDGSMPSTETDVEGVSQSRLRIKSQIDQVIFINEIEDDEDLAKLGTGRMAQIIPKFDLLFKMDREWIGFGFLSRSMTTQKKYIIENDLYGNPDEAVEVAIGVEVVPLQIILTIGYLGLILHILYFFYTWWAIRKLKYSHYYLCTILCFSIIGCAGMSGLIRPHGLYLSGLVLAAVIMANKREIGGFALPKPKEKKTLAQ